MKSILMGLCLAIMGCGPKEPSWKVSNIPGSAELRDSVVADYGCTRDRFNYVILRDSEVPIASNKSVASAGTEGLRQGDTVEFKDGSRLDYLFFKDDQKTEMRINGKMYDPKEGMVFVCRKEGTQIAPQQKNVNLTLVKELSMEELRSGKVELTGLLQKIADSIPTLKDEVRAKKP